MKQVQTEPINLPHLSVNTIHTGQRVDWRFLLPNSQLGSVAYIGSWGENLVDSLLPFCESLQFVDLQEKVEVSSSFDLLIMKKPALSTFEQVNHLLKPAGYVYVESSNLLSTKVIQKGQKKQALPPGSEFHSGRQYIAAIMNSGFNKIQAYWVWPDFENCTKYIALDSPSALIYTLNKTQSGSLQSLKSNLVKLAMQSGFIMQWVPHFCIVAQRKSS